MKVIINGRFLGQKITGVQRYAREIVRELDGYVSPGDQWEICIPEGVKTDISFQNIMPVWKKGFTQGPMWDYWSYDSYVRKESGLAVNLCNVASLTGGVTVIHDVTYRANPQFHTSFKNFFQIVKNRLNYRLATRKSKRIITVSKFSKSEIMKYYGVHPDKISVVCNAWQHMERVQASADTFQRFPFLESEKYYYSLSTLAANKNFKWILYAAKRNPSDTFAIAGGGKLQGAAEAEGLQNLPNIHFLGYVSDEDSKALMKNCKAFLFPTFYEGFGLPPLEAAASGAPEIIVSDTPCMREVYGGYARYIDPYNYDCDFSTIPPTEYGNFDDLLERYSWKKSAYKLWQLLNAEKNLSDH